MSDLFDIQNTLSFNTDKLTEGKEYDYVTRTSLNQGILQTTGFVNKENINPAGTWSLGLLQMDFFYRNKPWYAGQFVRKIVPKIEIPNKAKLFFQTILNLQKSVLLQVLVRNVDETFRNINVQLPQTSNKEIDFEFIEEFVRELERARLRELEAYLVATGLNNYQLSYADKKVLSDFRNLQWREFRIGDLYNKVEFTKKKFNKKSDTSSFPSAEYSLPIINAKHGDNGIMFYGKESVFPSEEMTIDIVQNGAIATGDVYPQPQRTGVLWDAYLIKAKKHIDSRLSLFFFTCSIWKSIKPKFSYEFKATWDRVKNEKIYLPVTTDGKTPDLATMEQIIAAVQKIVIADVAKYTARNLEATQQVIEAQDEPQVEQTITPLIHSEYKPGYIPLYTLRAACGYFGEGRLPEEEGWIDASGLGFTPDSKRHFAVHAKGDSMLPKIKDGDICIFEWYNAGSRNGEIVLSQISEYDDAYDGRYTIKRYHSEKTVTDEGWQHSKVELQPLNPDFEPIELSEDDDVRTIGIFKCVL